MLVRLHNVAVHKVAGNCCLARHECSLAGMCSALKHHSLDRHLSPLPPSCTSHSPLTGNQVAGTSTLFTSNYGRIVLMPASVCAADMVTGPCKADMERIRAYHDTLCHSPPSPVCGTAPAHPLATRPAVWHETCLLSAAQANMLTCTHAHKFTHPLIMIRRPTKDSRHLWLYGT
jgi:hypothetical protein